MDEIKSKIDEILEDEIMRISTEIRSGLTFSRLIHHLNKDTENVFKDLDIMKTLFRLHQEEKIRIKPKPDHFCDFTYASVIYTPYSLAWKDQAPEAYS